tara:strand:- start:27604 stop:27975 length:372 start_codon:yes stop_codon:yes gene_type:complete
MKTYQQGDVILKEVHKNQVEDIIGLNSSKEYKMEHPTDKVVLALGEATGHHHRFEAEKLDPHTDVIGYSGAYQEMPNVIEILGGEATLYHEEHNPLTIPEGSYAISIVRELDHISGNTRLVVD